MRYLEVMLLHASGLRDGSDRTNADETMTRLCIPFFTRSYREK
jgi:hypothetical protein